MRHVCAYLLAAMGTNAANAANMKAILASVGVEADDKQLEIVIQKFGNKNIEKVIAEGKEGIKSGFFLGGGNCSENKQPFKNKDGMEICTILFWIENCHNNVSSLPLLGYAAFAVVVD